MFWCHFPHCDSTGRKSISRYFSSCKTLNLFSMRCFRFLTSFILTWISPINLLLNLSPFLDGMNFHYLSTYIVLLLANRVRKWKHKTETLKFLWMMAPPFVVDLKSGRGSCFSVYFDFLNFYCLFWITTEKMLDTHAQRLSL